MTGFDISSPHADVECPVCLGPVTDGCRTPCQHLFCAACIRATLRSQPPLWNRGTCPLCRTAVSLYSTSSVADGSPLEIPAVTSIFGEAYLQHSMEGVAAYHFDAPDDCSISYECAPDDWKLLDGSSPPARKEFLHPRFDAETRTFTGTIEWGENTFHGDARWEYEMIFADDFVTICGGNLTSFGPDGQQTRKKHYPTDLQYVRRYALPQTIAGRAYMQGGQLGLASYHFSDSLEQAYISYEAAPETWRLDDGNPPPARKKFINVRYDSETRTFSGTICWGDTTFGGGARWEYEMTFAENFTIITAGQVRIFDTSGEETTKHVFGVHLQYRLYIEEEAQLFHMLMRATQV